MTTRQTLQFIIAALFLGSLACLADESAPSAEMKRIVAYHQRGTHDLDPKGLKVDPTMHSPKEEEMAGYEVYNVPYPRAMADYFTYRVYLHRQTGRYWINIGGGIAGVNRFHGPGSLAEIKAQ